MTRDEFVEKHGEEAWEKLVKPHQANRHSAPELRANSNIICHAGIMEVLDLMGLKVSGLKEARLRVTPTT